MRRTYTSVSCRSFLRLRPHPVGVLGEERWTDSV
jgi:hypothetical protein